MKKVFMTLVVAAMAMTVNAQTYIGGGIGFSSTSYDGESTTSFSLRPELGYGLNDKWGIGVTLGYAESGKGDNKEKKFVIEPYARYTAAQIGKVNLFFDGVLQYINEDQGVKVNTIGLGVKPGVAYNLNKKLTVATHLGFLGYQNEKPDVEGAKDTSWFGLNFDSLDLNFSLYYNF